MYAGNNQPTGIKVSGTTTVVACLGHEACKALLFRICLRAVALLHRLRQADQRAAQPPLLDLSLQLANALHAQSNKAFDDLPRASGLLELAAAGGLNLSIWTAWRLQISKPSQLAGEFRSTAPACLR